MLSARCPIVFFWAVGAGGMVAPKGGRACLRAGRHRVRPPHLREGRVADGENV
jgi:hypothetical protein